MMVDKKAPSEKLLSILFPDRVIAQLRLLASARDESVENLIRTAATRYVGMEQPVSGYLVTHLKDEKMDRTFHVDVTKTTHAEQFDKARKLADQMLSHGVEQISIWSLDIDKEPATLVWYEGNEIPSRSSAHHRPDSNPNEMSR